jgi:hypothetical protein
VRRFLPPTLVVALVVVIALLAAGTALAFDGARDNYNNSTVCFCHLGIQTDWGATLHAQVGDPATFAVNAFPISDGPSCAGCHSGNYDPSKAQGTIVPPATAPTYPYANTGGDDAFSEPFVGCSTCHYNGATMGPPHSAQAFNIGQMGDAQICGQCHARYSTNKTAYALLDPTGTTPNPYRPEYVVDYNPFTTDINDVLWVPPTAPDPPALARFGTWSGGQSTKAHGEGAVQYWEWNENKWSGTGSVPVSHVNGVDTLRELNAQFPGAVQDSCLTCHSADYQLVTAWNASHDASHQQTLPTLATAKFADTCVSCHKPHQKGAEGATWNEERNPQLIDPEPGEKTICTKCHDWKDGPYQANGSLEPGAEVFYPQQQMMNGVGAIDVARQPSVHKDGCIKCHMVPTGYGFDGAAGTAANHVLAIISPQEAASQTANTATGPQHMPYSSCSTCHGRSSDPLATYLQPVYESRQTFVEGQLTMLQSALDAAASKLGYANAGAAHDALTAAGHAAWTDDQTAFLKAWTNDQFVANDNSKGIHNWAYTTATLGKAMEQVSSVRQVAGLTMTVKSPKATNTSQPNVASGTLTYGTSTTVYGSITGGDVGKFGGATVELWASPTAQGMTNWMPIGTAFVYVSGGAPQYSFTVKPTANTMYMVKFMGNTNYGQFVATDSVTLNVAYKVTITASKKSVTHGAKVTVSGVVTPVGFASTYKVTIQRYTSGAWKTFKSGLTANATSGKYSYKFTTKKGSYKLRAFFGPTAPPSSDLVKGTSGTVTIKAK